MSRRPKRRWGAATLLRRLNQPCDADADCEAFGSSCDAIGSGPLPDGTDCAEDDQVCYLGECREVVCDGPFCQDGNAWSCQQEGTRAELNDTCSLSEYYRDGYCYSDTCTATLLNGSYNWTRSAATFNEENLIVTSDPGLVATFTRQFHDMWQQLGG